MEAGLARSSIFARCYRIADPRPGFAGWNRNRALEQRGEPLAREQDEASVGELDPALALEAPAEAAEKAAAIAKAGLPVIGRKLAWPALLRKLDRVNPSYRD